MFASHPRKVPTLWGPLLSALKGVAWKPLVSKVVTKPFVAKSATWAMRVTPWLRRIERAEGLSVMRWTRENMPVIISRNLRKIYVTSFVGATGASAAIIFSSVEHFEDRYRLMIYAPAHERSLGREARALVEEEYGERILQQDHPLTRVVNQIGARLLENVGPFPEPQPEWAIHVVDGLEVNALALPSGDIFVFCGMLDAAADETCCAAVLAHEISHVVARHAVETLSMKAIYSIPLNYLYSSVLVGDASLLTKPLRAKLASLVMQLYVDLPYSRRMESEADRLGLELLHRSGYDVNHAVKLWSRVQKSDPSSNPSGAAEFYSTHPCYERRIQDQTELARKLTSGFEQPQGDWSWLRNAYRATLRSIGKRGQDAWSFEEWTSHLKYVARIKRLQRNKELQEAVNVARAA